MQVSDDGPMTLERNSETLVSADPGEQVFVSVDKGSFPLDRLPEDAFENLLVVTAGKQPSAIERTVRDLGHEPRRVGIVPVSGAPVNYDGPMWCAPRVSPHDLTGISIQFNRGLGYVKPGTGWILFDNLTVLLMYADSNRVFQLLNSVVSSVRSAEARGVYAINRDATKGETYQQFRNLFDLEVDLR